MPNDADRAGTPAGVFGAELRFYRTRAGLSQKDLAALVHVSNDVISKIETGERPPAEDFPPRLDAVPGSRCRSRRPAFPAIVIR
jgi:DNA-binding XRE family transcriptional regulator